MMINRIRRAAFLIAAISFTAGQQASAQAQPSQQEVLNNINTITTAVPLLMISPDARAGGMGDQGVASQPDVNSIHWNSSKLAFAEKKTGFGVSYTPWLRQLVNDMFIGYVAGYSKLKNGQAIGGSLRYFSLGSITFTDNNGQFIRDFKPNEFAIDVAYSRKLSEYFSGGIALRYIHSNLTGGTTVEGADSKAGNSVAADVNGYFKKEIEVGNKDADFTAGFNISNIGSKMSYTQTGTKNFIPTNLRIGSGLDLKLNEYNSLGFMIDINKLLVPTPPVYKLDSTNALTNEIALGKDPNVGVPQGMLQSFSDAPGGFREEMREFNIGFGMEYWYDKQFAFRGGYFWESETKGNRKYFTLGAGLRYNVFGLDLAYLIPTDQRNPLGNTLHFTLSFDFDGTGTGQNKEATQD